jgi:lipopolysaccharide export system ATP-binding protein
MLELKNVEVKYLNTILVLKGVNIQLETGGFSCILGANGAGKTTTFYVIVGLIAPDKGQVRVDDQDITNLPMYQRARSGSVISRKNRLSSESLRLRRTY